VEPPVRGVERRDGRSSGRRRAVAHKGEDEEYREWHKGEEDGEDGKEDCEFGVANLELVEPKDPDREEPDEALTSQR
jgi:hypothetical protein